MAATQYTVQHTYRSAGVRLGPWKAGDVVELDVETADWVNRDSPGCLFAARLADEPAPVEPLARRKPPGRDRQHRGPGNRTAS